MSNDIKKMIEAVLSGGSFVYAPQRLAVAVVRETALGFGGPKAGVRLTALGYEAIGMLNISRGFWGEDGHSSLVRSLRKIAATKQADLPALINAARAARCNVALQILADALLSSQAALRTPRAKTPRAKSGPGDRSQYVPTTEAAAVARAEAADETFSRDQVVVFPGGTRLSSNSRSAAGRTGL